MSWRQHNDEKLYEVFPGGGYWVINSQGLGLFAQGWGVGGDALV